MIDLETLGTAANSVILSIGAVQFDDSEIVGEFYSNIDIDSCQERGLRIDGRTLMWWFDQSAEARAALFHHESSLANALRGFSNAFNWTDTEVWCNGLSFDLPILDSAFRACGMTTPWAYYNGRDYRTIKNELPREVFKSLEISPVVKHDALEDARAQALTLLQIREYQARSAAMAA